MMRVASGPLRPSCPLVDVSRFQQVLSNARGYGRVATQTVAGAGAKPLRRVPVQGRSMARVGRMLDACAGLVDEVGYDGLTTTLLAERAGVAIGSVYQFFPDKRAIVQALTLRSLEGYLERLAARLAEEAFADW